MPDLVEEVIALRRENERLRAFARFATAHLFISIGAALVFLCMMVVR
jgi:hypothetical protein